MSEDTKTPPTESEARQINIMRAWCLDNYHNGADAMVECWKPETYLGCIRRASNFKEALEALQDVAAVYKDRQGDAKNSIIYGPYLNG